MSKKPPTLKCKAEHGRRFEAAAYYGNIMIEAVDENGRTVPILTTPAALRAFTEKACAMVEKGSK